MSMSIPGREPGNGLRDHRPQVGIQVKVPAQRHDGAAIALDGPEGDDTAPNSVASAAATASQRLLRQGRPQALEGLPPGLGDRELASAGRWPPAACRPAGSPRGRCRRPRSGRSRVGHSVASTRQRPCGDSTATMPPSAQAARTQAGGVGQACQISPTSSRRAPARSSSTSWPSVTRLRHIRLEQRQAQVERRCGKRCAQSWAR